MGQAAVRLAQGLPALKVTLSSRAEKIHSGGGCGLEGPGLPGGQRTRPRSRLPPLGPESVLARMVGPRRGWREGSPALGAGRRETTSGAAAKCWSGRLLSGVSGVSGVLHTEARGWLAHGVGSARIDRHGTVLRLIHIRRQYARFEAEDFAESIMRRGADEQRVIVVHRDIRVDIGVKADPDSGIVELSRVGGHPAGLD